MNIPWRDVKRVGAVIVIEAAIGGFGLSPWLLLSAGCALLLWLYWSELGSWMPDQWPWARHVAIAGIAVMALTAVLRSIAPPQNESANGSEALTAAPLSELLIGQEGSASDSPTIIGDGNTITISGSTPDGVTLPEQPSEELEASDQRAGNRPNQTVPSSSNSRLQDTQPGPVAQPQISQSSTGANSPNIVTTGPNSPVTINAPQGWRMLTDMEVLDLGNTLRQFSGQRAVIRVPNQGDNRLALAQQMAAGLRDAEWDVGIETPMLWGPPEAEPPHGIQLHVREVTPAAEVLGSALVALFGPESIPAGHQDDSFQAGVIEVNIWPKRFR